MKALFKLALAATIVASTYYAIVRVAEEKAGALAGGGTYPLDPGRPEEWRAYGGLLDQLRRWGEGDFAAALVGLQETGDLHVAPGLAGGRSAVYVSSLGLVSRIFVQREELVPRGLPFPELDVPEAAQLTFARIRLAGTLYHELQHHQGLEDEAETYEREIDWYLALRERVTEGAEGEERRWLEWAVDSAVETAAVARETAAGAGPGRDRP